MHKVFISYHHKNDQDYKNELLNMSHNYKFHYGSPMFIDMSVDTGDIPEDLSDETIRERIRDEYLQDSTVTILLVGTETKYRKHVDWELYSSMYNGKRNKQSGILVVNLPTINEHLVSVSHSKEKKLIYPEITSWTSVNTRKKYEERYPYMPERIIDNLLNPKAFISVTNWSKIKQNPNILKFLIDATFEDRTCCNYDLSRQMRRQNFNPYVNLSPDL